MATPLPRRARFCRISLMRTQPTDAAPDASYTRLPRVVAWSLWFLALLQMIACGALMVLNRSIVRPGLLVTFALVLLTAVVYASVGGLIGSRLPRNPLGWLLCASGIALGFAAF